MWPITRRTILAKCVQFWLFDQPWDVAKIQTLCFHSVCSITSMISFYSGFFLSIFHPEGVGWVSPTHKHARTHANRQTNERMNDECTFSDCVLVVSSRKTYWVFIWQRQSDNFENEKSIMSALRMAMLHRADCLANEHRACVFVCVMGPFRIHCDLHFENTNENLFAWSN